jgi:hypothetical protein
MGGCAGKKKSKSYETKSDSNKKPETKTKGLIDEIFFSIYVYVILDDRVESKSQVFNFEIKKIDFVLKHNFPSNSCRIYHYQMVLQEKLTKKI